MNSREKQEISCHRRGLIPGPKESYASFAARVAASPTLEKISTFPYPFEPDWISVSSPCKRLPFWEGGATWIEEGPQGERSCKIQIRPSIPFYSQGEILSHEMIHAIRLMFDEPRFEEILAFHTSKKKWRRFLGPLFNRPLDTHLFLAFLLLSWIVYMAGMFLDIPFLSWSLPLPLIALIPSLIRLIHSQSLFSKALSRLPLEALVYLTDQEIKEFATLSKEEIEDYIATHPSPRLNQLNTMIGEKKQGRY